MHDGRRKDDNDIDDDDHVAALLNRCEVATLTQVDDAGGDNWSASDSREAAIGGVRRGTDGGDHLVRAVDPFQDGESHVALWRREGNSKKMALLMGKEVEPAFPRYFPYTFLRSPPASTGTG